MRKGLCVLLLSLFVLSKTSDADDNMKAFPPADEGMTRFVLQLPEQADETLIKVQLLVGKTVQTDEQNRYFFGGKINEETIQGWGFPRFVVKELGPMAGTLMAIDPLLQRDRPS